MADVIRDVEFFDLHGHQRRADLGKRALVVGAYLDTGAGRTIISTAIANRVRMIDVPSYRIQYTVPINQVASTRMTAMRLRVPGCSQRSPVPMLVAVSDEIIGKLDLPGVEVLIGQDLMQASRMRIDMAPGKGSEHVSCRPPPKGYQEVTYGGKLPAAARSTRSAPSTDPALWRRQRKFGVAGGPDEVVLTDEGMARAFSVGAQVRSGAPTEALRALASYGGEGLLLERRGSRLYPSALGRFDQTTWGYLRSLGYVESVGDQGVKLTAAGKRAVANGHEEQERLLARCQLAAGAARATRGSRELDPTKPLAGNAVAFFDVDGDPESLDLRAGEVPVDTVARYLRRRVRHEKTQQDANTELGARPGQIVVHYVGWNGPSMFTTTVKVQARK